MKIVLIGAAGQLAHDLKTSLGWADIVPWTRDDADLVDAESLNTKLRDAGPDAVVNAAAYNLVDQAEKEPEAAFAVNAFGVRNLAKVCGELGCTLMHFSTDYVFGLDQNPGRPWKETDAPGPVSSYGTSKLAGEAYVRTFCLKHFVVRTCGLYGVKGSRGKGGNFVETMLRLATTGKPVRVVSDQTCTPSFTADVANAASELLQTEAFGLYHLTNQGGCTWFEFASEIFKRSGLSVDCQPISAAEFNALAKRPAFSVLDLSKIISAGVTPPPSWQDALARYLLKRETK